MVENGTNKKSNHEEVHVGDIVLYTQMDGTTQVPAIITKLDSQESAYLDVFNIGGVGGFGDPRARGTGPNQWQPRPKKP